MNQKNRQCNLICHGEHINHGDHCEFQPVEQPESKIFNKLEAKRQTTVERSEKLASEDQPESGHTICQGKDGCGRKILLKDLEDHVMTHKEEGWREFFDKEWPELSSHYYLKSWIEKVRDQAFKEGSAYKGKANRESYLRGYSEAKIEILGDAEKAFDQTVKKSILYGKFIDKKIEEARRELVKEIIKYNEERAELWRKSREYGGQQFRNGVVSGHLWCNDFLKKKYLSKKKEENE